MREPAVLAIGLLVSSPYPLEHDAARLAVTGMRDAYARNYAAYRSGPTVDNVGVSAVDFANWASALDERLRVTAPNRC
jgi:hypothetical protein